MSVRAQRMGRRRLTNPSPALPVKLAFVDVPGQVHALNAGLQAAMGDIVCFTDDDCMPRPDWLERILQHYDRPEVAGVGGRDVVHHGDRVVSGRVGVVGRYAWYGRPIGNHHLELYPPRPAEVDILKGANMSFRRTLLPDFDSALQRGSAQCNDMDVSLALRRRGYKLVYDPLAVVDHYPAPRFGESTRHADAPHMLLAEGHNWMYVALKHAPFWQLPIVIAYGFLVGHARAYGLARAVIALPTDGPILAARRLWYSLFGKVAGIFSWLRKVCRGSAHGPKPAGHSHSD